ncbi:NRDE family protein [Flavobacterium psychrotolerans]|uniref:Transport and Golgi organization protein 2 n=1 Tax=Flavobacterium psychrotolerans TaxID=2169410 RepID=A0A2U1JH55_9FLAO|nr:NRDE family protein [Flavobacterium psychrotolerans]PWA04466.1 hypothetical protein DB895_11150 [Flavobacterium psychrotolerans]
MCTVSFVCSNGKVIITSNRDEQVSRPAILPKNYLINNKRIIFPKDPKAGGTWFAVAENTTVLVLLNGASEKHQWQPPYRKSRGLIVLDIISSDFSLMIWESINLNNIEPFTLVLYQTQKLYQLRWDGLEKELVQINEKQNYIWSSSTLYSQEIRDKRATWFYQFLKAIPEANEEELIRFHRCNNESNKENGLVINRNDTLKTLSITQAVIEQNKVELSHFDLLNHNTFVNSFVII